MARVVRLVRIVRVFRFLKLVKYMKIFGSAESEQIDEKSSSRMGVRLAELISRRVVMVVLFVFVVSPLLQIQSPTPDYSEVV